MQRFRMGIDVKIAKQAAEQFREEGYALIPQFIDGDLLWALQNETAWIYREALRHPASWRHGNLSYEILPETHFDKRYVVQAYWIAWVCELFETVRRSEPYQRLLEPLLGDSIKQVAQQIHWKPPGAGLTGYRFHQDLRFREKLSAYQDITENTVTTGLAIDPSTRANGCLQVIPRSHKRGYLGLSDESGTIMHKQTPEVELAQHGLNPEGIVYLEQEPGDLAVWGLLTVHGSSPNRSEQDRAFLLQSYVRADASDRGEWAFRNGVSTPLGPSPQLCKYEALHDNPEPHYIRSTWFESA